MMTKNVSLVSVVLLGLCLPGFVQAERYALHTFTKADGSKVEASIDKYSTSSQMARVRTEDGTLIELPFDQVSPENQEILTEWKMNKIVDSSKFQVEYKRVRGKASESFEGDLKTDATPINYTLTLTNKERIPIAGLEIVYAVAYETGGVKGKSFADVNDELGFYFEKLPVMDIPAKETITLEMPTFSLKTVTDVSSGGDGGWGGSDGGGGKSVEEFKGVVFRFFRNGEVVREEASPSSIAKRKFEIRPANAPAKPVEKK